MRAALESVEITEIDTNPGATAVSFVAPAGMDIEAELNKLAESTKELKNWSKSD